MNKTLSVYSDLTEDCFDWIQKWGYSLAFALTQSLEISEQVVAESMAAVLTNSSQERLGDGMHRFAKFVCDLGNKKAFRGFSHDDFFKLNTSARAAVILKVRGRFSLAQIAGVLNLSVGEVERLLEGARLSFSRGRAWLMSSPGRRQLDDAYLVEPCPDWNQGLLFSRYLDNELPVEQVRGLHNHFVKCTSCRANLIHYKNTYSDWLLALPEPDLTKNNIRYLRKIARMSNKTRRPLLNGPLRILSPLPGLKKLMHDKQLQGFVMAVVLFLFFYYYLK